MRIGLWILGVVNVTALAINSLKKLSSNDGVLSLTLNSSSLQYTVEVNGKTWFDSNGADGGYMFSSSGSASWAKQKLKLVGTPQQGSGTDATGAFTSLALSFAQGSSSGPPAWIATFKAYKTRPALVFSQKWSKAAAFATGGSTFPSLRQVDTKQMLGTLEYTGLSCGFMVGARETFPGITGGNGKGYIAISPRDSTGRGTQASVVIGPVTEHFVNQARNSNRSLVYGVSPTFKMMPQGYEIETVLVASVQATLDPSGQTRSPPTPAQPERISIAPGGVNDALMEFGDFLLSRHNKTRARGDHNTGEQKTGLKRTTTHCSSKCSFFSEAIK